MLGSCGSPPKPPSVDETRRHPVNSSAAIDLQTCRSDLQNSRISAAEIAADAAASKAWAERLAQTAKQSARRGGLEDGSGRNTVYSVLFAFGSSQVLMSPEEVSRLVTDARRAAWIVLSGRTDGTTDSTVEGRIARARAEAVRDLLVRHGIEPARVRATWQPVGDPAADGATEAGRALNRRVEIELYDAAPKYASLAEPPPSPDRS